MNYLKNGCGMIAEEREKQQAIWSESHDDGHINGELGDSGAAYAMAGVELLTPNLYPFKRGWNPSEHRASNLVKAGAFIAAEIDRLHRRFMAECNEITMDDFGFECYDEMDAYELKFTPWVGRSAEEFVRQEFAGDYEQAEAEKHNQEVDLNAQEK